MNAVSADAVQASGGPVTRATILSAARFLAARHGLASFSMEGVASRSGFSRRTVYNQFESREALYRATMLQMLETIEDQLDLDLPCALPLAAAVRRFCIAGQTVMRTSEYREIAIAIDRDGREAPWLERAFERRILQPLKSRIELYLLSMMARGELEFDDLDGFCSDLVAMMEVATGVGARRSGVALTLEEIVDVVLKRLSRADAQRVERSRFAQSGKGQ